MKFNILNSRRAEVEAVLKRYKLGYTFGEPAFVDVVDIIDQTEFVRQVRMVPIDIPMGYMPDEEHRFVATLEPVKGANIIRQVDNTKELPDSYRVSHNHCDHCNKARQRNEYYLIERVRDGALLQVGKSCLKDLFPISAGALVSFANVMGVVYNTCDEDSLGCGGGWGDEYSVNTMLTYALHCTAEFGYEADGGTKAHIMGLLGKVPRSQLSLREGDVADMLAWFATQKRDSNFMHSLSIIVSQESVTSKNLGVLVCLPNMWLKDIAKRKAPLVDVVEGRVVCEGVIANIKTVYNEYGEAYKMLLQCKGFKLYGSLPKALYDARIGDTVRFTATTTAKELGFGFFSRPAKVVTIT
jgi:hypothetical protein